MTALATLASPRRQEILRLIWTEEKSAGDIHRAMEDVSFGAVSLQLRTLLDAGFIEMRAQNQHRYYRAKREALAEFVPALERMWNDALWRLKLSAELEHSRRGPQSTSRKGIQ
jgi:DNA-binding transcriptional ArsR family regulator